jgi:hypothetical protein
MKRDVSYRRLQLIQVFFSLSWLAIVKLCLTSLPPVSREAQCTSKREKKQQQQELRGRKIVNKQTAITAYKSVRQFFFLVEKKMVGSLRSEEKNRWL